MSEPAVMPDDLDEAAAAWFARRRAPGWDDRAQVALDAWLAADPRHRERYDEIAAAWEELGALTHRPALRSLRAEALAVRPARRVDWRIAASIAAVAVVSALALTPREVWRRDLAPPTVQAEQIYRTATGERSSVTLADGSTMVLNTGSEARVRYSAGRRDIVLASGEAWFDVAKNPRRPFVVAAAGSTVTAIGTSFDVRLEPGRLRVAVVEGRVAVVPPGAARAEVAAGQRADLDGGVLTVRPAGPVAGDWRQGRIELASATLAEAVAEMNRYRTTPIRLADPSLGRLKVSGVFDAGESSSFLQALPLTHPVAVHSGREGPTIGWRPDKKTSRAG